MTPSTTFGVLFLVGGLIMAAYFFLFFDASVASPTTEILGQAIGGGRVANLGLLNEQSNGIIIGMGLAIIGAIFQTIGPAREAPTGDAH